MCMFKSRRRPARARVLAAVMLLALGSSCSGGAANTDFGDNDPSIVVALGDSITFGKHDQGIDACGTAYRGRLGFCTRLQETTGKTMINEGVCGERSGGGLSRINEVLKRWRPAVLLIDYSPNDVVYGPDESILNLRALIAAARANKTVPILGTLTPAVGDHEAWEPFIVTMNARILALCDEEKVACADHYQAFTGDSGFRDTPYTLLDDDGLHPNTAGYTLMAETWREPLMRLF